MKTIHATTRARQLSNAVVFKGNTASVGRITFVYDTSSGYVDFLEVDERLQVHPIFDVCHNHSVVKRYNDHMQAITIALGFNTYCAGRTELTIVPVEPVYQPSPRVDIFGEYVVGGSRPAPVVRVRPSVRFDVPTSRVGLVGTLIALGVVAAVGALLSDD